MSTPKPTGRPKKPDPLVKPMHLRLSVSQDAYVAEKAEAWGVRRQDAVRHIIAEHMHTEEQ